MEDSSTSALVLSLRDPLIECLRKHTLLCYCDFKREECNTKFEETLTIPLFDIYHSIDISFAQFCDLIRSYVSLTFGRTKVQYDMGKCHFSYRSYSYPPMYFYQSCDEEIESMLKFYLPEAIRIYDALEEYEAGLKEEEDSFAS